MLLKRADCVYDGIYRFHVERQEAKQLQPFVIRVSTRERAVCRSGVLVLIQRHVRRDLSQMMFDFRDAYDDPYHHYKEQMTVCTARHVRFPSIR